MEYTVYYNHPERGYGFHVTSPGFQEKYKRSLEDICCRVTEPKTAAGNTISLRYTPLLDRYLMSVIFRQPYGDGLQTRGVNTLVNILMTAEEADMQLFNQPSAEALMEFANKATALLQKHMVRVALPEQQPTLLKKNRIPNAQLLNAATYAAAPSVEKQAFFAVETCELQEVAAMLEQLPRKLRNQTSFLTGIQSTKESINIAVSFGSHKMMEELAASDFSGGQSSSKKYLYYFGADGECRGAKMDKEGVVQSRHLLNVLTDPPFPELTKPLLLDRVENWEQLACLAALDTKDPMLEILELVPRENLLEYLRRADVSDATLAQMENAAKKQHNTVVRNAVRQTRQRLLPAEPVRDEPIDNPQESVDISYLQRKLELSKKHRALKKTALKLALKLLITAAMVVGLVWLAKDLLYLETLKTGTVITITIGLTEAKQMLLTAAAVCLSAALSSWITYHITKWRTQKNEKK